MVSSFSLSGQQELVSGATLPYNAPMHLFELEPSWQEALKEHLQSGYLYHLAAFVEKERDHYPVFPPRELVFNALKLTPFHQVKVVIIGQDPYHGPGQAHGLCFSVPRGVAVPPSLQNIYKELNRDLALPIPDHGCLLSWAEQGVLLLNATLTVRQAEPMSHHGQGWEKFTDAVVEKLFARTEPLVFVLWGKSAQEKCKFLNQNQSNHLILKAPHPSPLSAHQGFLGCGHFSKINNFLSENKKNQINWKI